MFGFRNLFVLFTVLVLVGQANAADLISGIQASPAGIQPGVVADETVCGLPATGTETFLGVLTADEKYKAGETSNLHFADGCITAKVELYTNARGPLILLFRVNGKYFKSQTGALSAVDLASANRSTPQTSEDIPVRRVLEGMACPSSDAACLADFRKKAWGSGRGTSAQEGAAVRAGIVSQATDAVFKDQRYQKALEAVNALNAAVQAGKITSSAAVDLKPVYDRMTEIDTNLQNEIASHNETKNRLAQDEQLEQETRQIAISARATAFHAGALSMENTPAKSVPKTFKQGAYCEVYLDLKAAGTVNLSAAACGDPGQKKKK